MLGAALRVPRPCPEVEPDQGSHPSDTASSKCGMWLGGSEGVCVCVCVCVCEINRARQRERENSELRFPPLVRPREGAPASDHTMVRMRG